MKIIASVLDSVHTLAREVERSTRRKKRIRREHIIGAFHVARIVASGVATVVPKVAPIAVVLNSLSVDPTEKKLDASDSESHQ